VQDAGKGAVEVLDAKEQSNPAGELAPDGGSLLVTIGAGEYESGATLGRPHHDPPLRATVGRHGRRVLGQDEPQRAGEELDGRVVVVDDQRYELERHPADARTRLQVFGFGVWSGREDLNLDPFPGREACCNYTTSAKPASDEADAFEV
jgi:hypothetical protein